MGIPHGMLFLYLCKAHFFEKFHADRQKFPDVAM